MPTIKKVNARHQLYCCPKCHGPARFLHFTTGNPEDLRGKCAECGWVGDGKRQPTLELAFVEWQRAVAAEPETQGLDPVQLPMSDAAMIEACARVQGWIDYERDGGNGAYNWYLDPESAPFCRFINKSRYNPLRDGHDAHALAQFLGMKLDYDGVLGPTATTRGSNTTYEVNLRDGFDFGALVGVPDATAGVMAMYRAIVIAAARHYQQGLHLGQAK